MQRILKPSLKYKFEKKICLFNFNIDFINNLYLFRVVDIQTKDVVGQIVAIRRSVRLQYKNL